MMKKLFFQLLCMSPLALFAQQPFTIQGSVRGLAPSVSQVYISYASNGENVLDSTLVSGGRYRFQGTITQPTRVDLRAGYAYGIKPSMSRDLITLFVTPATVTVNSTDSFSNAVVSGSSVNNEFLQLQAAAKPFQSKTQELTAQMKQYKAANDKSGEIQTEKQMTALDNEMRENVYAGYVRQNPRSPLAFFALQQYAGATIQNPKEALELFNLLPESLKNSHDGQRMYALIIVNMKTAAGQAAPDFTQTDMNGNSVTLSSLRGKTVLINFWASWCGPCRALDAGLVNLYNKYQNNGLVIINISLDKPGTKQDWLKAIHDDKLNNMINVTDLRFWNNAVAQQYGIASMPQNILVNRQGIIVARNLKSYEVENKIQSLLGGDVQ